MVALSLDCSYICSDLLISGEIRCSRRLQLIQLSLENSRFLIVFLEPFVGLESGILERLTEDLRTE